MWSHQRNTNKVLLMPAKYSFISCVSYYRHWVPFEFISNNGTDFYQLILCRVKLCSSLAEQMNFTKPYAYDWPWRACFMIIILCSQLFSNIKGTFIDGPNARKVMWVSMSNPLWLTSMEPKAFYQLYVICTIPPRSQQCKIIFYQARHNLRASVICPCTIK